MSHLLLHHTKRVIMKKHFLLFLFLSAMAIQGMAQPCQASFSYMPDSTGGVQFTNTSTGTYTHANWSFGDGTASTQINPYHQYNANGWWVVCLTIYDTAGSGCQSSICDTVLVGSTFFPCVASFTTQQSGNTVNFYNTSTGFYQGVLWNYGDGTTGTQSSHTYASPGTYTACLYIGYNPASNCSDSICQTITVAAPPNCNAQFSWVDTTGGVLFMPQVAQAGWQYQWSFGDGNSSNDVFPFHTYATAGTWLVCLTVTDTVQNCSVTWCDSVTSGIPLGCQAAFSYQQTNGTVYFGGYNATGGGVTTWQWNFGDGTTGTTQYPSHTYTQSGTYTVCLVITSAACTDSICQTVTINLPSNCNAQFNVGDSAGVYYFIPVVNSASYTYFWDFGDGTTSTLTYPNHQYNGTGPFVACLTVTDSSMGCTATACDTIYTSVFPPPVPCQAYFSFSSDSLGNVQFYNASTGNFTFTQWSFGDGTGSQLFNPTHLFSGPGPYVVCLTVFGNSPASSCQSTFCDTIYPGANAQSCVPVFYTYPDSSAFGNGNMTFNLMNTCANTTYTWDFGDGTTATGPNHVHNYNATGWYNVCVTAVTPTNTYTFCNTVYAFRVSTGIGSVESLNSSIYPNPVATTANLKFNANGNTQIEILSLDGRLVWTQQAGSQIGEIQVPLDFSTMENGLYFIRIQSGDIRGTVKLLVQH
jgi:PKD repeat protein